MAGMNSQVHFFLKTELKERLKKEAKKREVSFSELCRLKLGGSFQLDRIEEMLKKLEKRIKF
jgi:hypothetical protein